MKESPPPRRLAVRGPLKLLIRLGSGSVPWHGRAYTAQNTASTSLPNPHSPHCEDLVTRTRPVSVWFALFIGLLPQVASAQIVEAAGSRSLGMGGAFVAVADDSSATWWNPAGLAAGPFLDVALGRAVTSQQNMLPVTRDRVAWFAITTPPFGFSYYRLRLTDIQPFDPTAAAPADREDRRAGVPVRSISVSQLGATLVQTLLPGVHVGTTVKYVRGTVRSSRDDSLMDGSRLLARGEDLEGGDAESRFDLDVGLLAVAGPVRMGGLIRNVRQPVFGDARLPRQVRAGVAFDGERAGLAPLLVALDADLRRYRTGSGDRRVVAVGGERWIAARRVGLRAGARFNTVAAQDRAVTAGVSVAARAALFVDAHVVRGGAADDQGWGIAARVSF